MRAVNGVDVGGQPRRDDAACTLRGDEERAADGLRKLLDEAFLCRNRRDEVWCDAVSAERGGGRVPDRGDAWKLAEPPLRELLGSVRARDDHPVISAGVDRVVADRLHLDQRTRHRLEAFAPERLDERLP